MPKLGRRSASSFLALGPMIVNHSWLSFHLPQITDILIRNLS